MKIILSLLAVALVVFLLWPKPASSAAPLYFTAPEVVVDEVTTLLRAKAWPELARYYDLSDSDVKRADLESGAYFDAPAPGPGIQNKKPFAPGFRFIGVEKTGDPAVVRVSAGLEIDQGGGMKQRVLTAFLLRKHEKGWQLLPRHD